MAPRSLTTNANVRITLDDAAVETLAASLRCDLLVPGTPRYDESRSIWNAMIDRRPGVIVECLGAADVAHAVRFAAEFDVVLSVRSGGHDIAGNAVCDGGMMISPARMKSVRVDPVARRPWVEPGNTIVSGGFRSPPHTGITQLLEVT